MPGTSEIKAVIFDLGGVVMGSPLHAIAEYERRQQIPEGAFNRHVVGSVPDGAWHRLERGEVTMGDDFFALLDAEIQPLGHSFSTRDMMELIAEYGKPRPQMLEAITRLRDAGWIVAALTSVPPSPPRTHKKRPNVDTW